MGPGYRVHDCGVQPSADELRVNGQRHERIPGLSPLLDIPESLSPLTALEPMPEQPFYPALDGWLVARYVREVGDQLELEAVSGERLGFFR